MVICRVTGTVVSTIKHPAYKGWKLLMVQPMHLTDDKEDNPFIAIDAVHAGVGDAVMVMREGSGARQITGIPDAPIISVVVGVLDSLQIAG
jgi:ethanolamine utilization protein EutN